MSESDSHFPDHRTFSYRIDKDGKILWANEHWDAFAEENGGTGLKSKSIVGKTLWHFFADRHTILMHELIVSIAHARRKPIRWQFRCDSPDVYRVMESVVTPLENGETEYLNRFTNQYQRPTLPILDHRSEKSDEFITLCSWCKGVIQGQHVVTIEYIDENYSTRASKGLPQLSHGMCRDCYEQQSSALDTQA